MTSKTPRFNVFAAVVFTVGVLAASELRADEPGAAPDGDTRFESALRALSERDLKAHYLRCSDAALRGSLGAGGIAQCSIVYETLLDDTFGGDFLALLAWSRQHSARTADTAYGAAR